MSDTARSRTAVKVAQGVLYLARDPRTAALLPPGAAEATERLLIAAGISRPWHLRLYRSPKYRRFVALVERAVAPGGILHLCLRKRFLDDEVRDAVTHGAVQVLVVGAGFDTLAPRLAAEFPDTLFVETDHPATHEVKLRAVETLGGQPENLHLRGVDLAATRLDDVLGAMDGWRCDAVSAVVAEGVLMYLTWAAAVDFLAAVRRGTAAGSRLLFSCLMLRDDGRHRVGPVSRLLLRLLGEPVHWGLHQRDLPGCLERHGYRLLPPAERYDRRRRYLEPAGLDEMPLGQIEHLVVAESADGATTGSSTGLE